MRGQHIAIPFLVADFELLASQLEDRAEDRS